ncbi:DUF3309 family protein [Cupriavidus sp. 2TAF22]
MLGVLVVVVLAMTLVAVVSVWHHSRVWGYMPAACWGHCYSWC